jgi:hypothetical protein
MLLQLQREKEKDIMKMKMLSPRKHLIRQNLKHTMGQRFPNKRIEKIKVNARSPNYTVTKHIKPKGKKKGTKEKRA